ncbi:ricin B-like lectin R40C1 [Phragmites australis]|uniref:ricin B-like lectin R40C1 n=1 Tax=Phragmites australis TaxID=29695 RepID=UPI002D78232A|nr:ricin B-like lectin R40C1 [Phragmites australis]
MNFHHGLGQPFKIFCRADEGYCVTIRDDSVVLAPANPFDDYQHWYKDMRYASSVKDEEGAPAFVLVNKATGEAIKHSHGRSHPVKLSPYNPDDLDLDESVLWTESNDVGDGFRCIRMVNNIYLNLDALHGVEDHGGVRDGTVVGLWEWHEGDNQSWKILPWGGEAYNPPAPSYGNSSLPVELAEQRTVRIFCKADEEYSITVRDGTVCLAPTDPSDDYQHWVKDMRHSRDIQDEEGFPAFALVNKATGEAIKHSLGQSHPVKLVPYDTQEIDESVLWTESKDVGDGFRCIRMVNNIYLNFDAMHGDEDHGDIRDGTEIVLWEWCEGDNQSWKIRPW